MISPEPLCSTAPAQPVKVQEPTWTATDVTCTVPPVLFRISTAPASKVQALLAGQPWKIVLGDPAHGVGKFVGFDRKLSTYPTMTVMPVEAATGAAVRTEADMMWVPWVVTSA